VALKTGVTAKTIEGDAISGGAGNIAAAVVLRTGGTNGAWTFVVWLV
jgi:hypothetical protein